jgi:NADH dehydrogenase
MALRDIMSAEPRRVPGVLDPRGSPQVANESVQRAFAPPRQADVFATSDVPPTPAQAPLAVGGASPAPRPRSIVTRWAQVFFPRYRWSGPTREIVIAGKGYGALALGRKLARDPNNHITFVGQGDHVLVTELSSATAGKSVTLNFNEIARREGFDVISHNLAGVDPAKNVARLENGTQVRYDALAVAVGGTAAAPDGTLGLRTAQDPLRIQEALDQLIAERHAKGDHSPVTVSVVGLGDVGLETAGALKHAYGSAIDLTLFGSKIKLPRSQARYANKILTRKLGAHVEQGVRVKVRGPHELMLEGAAGTRSVHTDLIISAMGARSAAEKIAFPSYVGHDARGRVVVNRFCQIHPNAPNVFAIGDCAQATTHSGKEAPQTVHMAERMAWTVAGNVSALFKGKRLKPLRGRTLGHLVSLGPNHAVGQLFGVPIRGRLATFLKRAVVRSYWNLNGPGPGAIRYAGLSGLKPQDNQASLRALNPFQREPPGQWSPSGRSPP